MARNSDTETNRLDEAARAGWLYYIAGNTQDEIASKLGVSRQTAQRLVSLAVSEKLIKVRLDHPIGHCLDLSQRLKDKFGLAFCEVVPADPASQSTTLGVAEATAAELERRLESRQPIVVALGSGRTLRAAAEQLPPMDCPQHKIVSLVGNIAPDGSASFYDVITRVADAVRAPHYPMPLPVIASTVSEKKLLMAQKPVKHVIELAGQADVTFVGVGAMGDSAPLLQDGFVNRDEMRALVNAGAVGEVVGWAFDRNGQLIEGMTNDRVASVALDRPARRLVIGAAMGPAKFPALRGALAGRIINGLITNEVTAAHLLKD
ncbi:MAG TPA: sugar-binding transcriptional regulator [Candidatus Angelobacter sp.]|nr:sugar-binding transcriptional regulator [Candidatus Angelobacter sp.]